jgi:SAM-dependent methyltransferase
MKPHKIIEKIKLLARKHSRFYKFSQKIYYGARRFMVFVFGTKFDEFVWTFFRGKGWARSSVEETPHPHRRLLLEKIKKINPDRVLEFGCGSGANLLAIAEKFPSIKEIFGIDINKDAVKIGNLLLAGRGYSNARIIFGNVGVLSKIADKSYDLVFSDAVLIYIAADDIQKVVSEMIRIAKKKIILIERHSENKSARGEYDGNLWTRNYRNLLREIGQSAEFTKISSEIWGGDWGRDGYLIEINKSNI